MFFPKKEDSQQSLIIRKLKSLWMDKRSFFDRVLLAGSAILAACFTFCFFGPLELVAFNESSLLYTYHDVFLLLAVFAVSLCIIGTVFVALLRGKIFNYVVCFIFAVTIGGYIQAFALNGSFGSLTGDEIRWYLYKRELIINLAAWAGIILICCFALFLNPKFWSTTVKSISLLLVVMQLVPTIAILTGVYDGDAEYDISRYSLTDDDFTAFSNQKNIVVFVLDRLDFDYIEEVMAVDESYFDRLDGFVGYNNTISAFARTMPALNQMFTGCEDLAYNVPIDEFYSKSWVEGGKDFLKDLSEQGFQIDLYTDVKCLFSEPTYPLQYVSNLKEMEGDVIPGTLLKKLMQLSVYRYAPLPIKAFFWADTNFYNTDVLDLKHDTYVFNDFYNFPRMENQLTADQDEKTFKFYHFNGPHAPHTMTADGTESEHVTSAREQLMGCMTYLYQVFDQMKELGIYEDSTIIILGDHGAAVSDSDPVRKETRIGLFYKPSGASGTPLTWSRAPVSTDNLPATLLKSAGAEYGAYGDAFDDIDENDDIVRYYYKAVVDSQYVENELYVYEIIGDASNFDNWKLKDIQKVKYGFN